MTTQPLSHNLCARNLPQHFNGCSCTSGPGAVTGEASIDLALVPAPATPRAPRVVGVIVKELQPGQHVIRGNRVQPVAGPIQPLSYGTVAVPLVATDPFEPDEFRLNGREQVGVFLDADDYDTEFVLGSDLQVGDTVVALGTISTITAREDQARGMVNFRTTKGDLRFTDVRLTSAEEGVTRLTRRTHTDSGVPIDSPAAVAPYFRDKTPGSWFNDAENADEHGIVSPDGAYAMVMPDFEDTERDTYAEDDRQWIAEGYLADHTLFERTSDSQDEARRFVEETIFARRA